ncbi:MAG: hypothetical protein AAF578_00305 [Pseudomonadota bacterium]
MDPATMMALLSLGQAAIGTQQTAAPAPAMNASPQPTGGLLGAGDSTSRKIHKLTPNTPTSPSQAAGLLGPAGASMMPADPMKAALDGPAGASMTPEAAPGDSPMSGFGSFFSNLDSNLQRPSMQLGLGLLGQASNNGVLPLAALAGMGLLGQNKVF